MYSTVSVYNAPRFPLTTSLVTGSTYLFLIVIKEPAKLSRDNLVNRNLRQAPPPVAP